VLKQIKKGKTKIWLASIKTYYPAVIGKEYCLEIKERKEKLKRSYTFNS